MRAATEAGNEVIGEGLSATAAVRGAFPPNNGRGEALAAASAVRGSSRLTNAAAKP